MALKLESDAPLHEIPSILRMLATSYEGVKGGITNVKFDVTNQDGKSVATSEWTE